MHCNASCGYGWLPLARLGLAIYPFAAHNVVPVFQTRRGLGQAKPRCEGEIFMNAIFQSVKVPSVKGLVDAIANNASEDALGKAVSFKQ